MKTKKEMMQDILFDAVLENKEKEVKALIELGVDVNMKIPYEFTLLHFAIHYNHIEIAKLLLERGADVRAKNNRGETPLHWAKNVETAKLLLDRGADVNAKNNMGDTPLHLAKNVEIAKLLIEKGADVEAKDKYGRIPRIPPELEKEFDSNLRNKILSEMKEKMDLM